MSAFEKAKRIKSNLGTDRYLRFSLGKEDYAIPLLSVKEVIAVPEITPIPYSPPYLVGIMNLRGQVISVIDFRKKLGITAESGTETSVIICDLDPLVLGVIVDSINAVASPGPGDISPKPDLESSRKTDYITGVFHDESKLILLLDLAKALGVEDIQLASQLTNKHQVA